MAFAISETELDKVIAQVEQELTGLIKSEAGILAKGEGSGPPPSEEGSASSASGGGESDPASAGGPPSDGGGDGDMPPAAAGGDAPPSAPASAAPAAGPDAAAGGVAPDEQAVVDEPDVQALQAEMLQMPPKHLEAVFLASKAALEQMAAGAPGAGASAPAPAPAGAGAPPMGGAAPSPSPAAAPSPSPAGAPPFGKAELGGQPIPPTYIGGDPKAASAGTKPGEQNSKLGGQPIPPTSIAGSPQNASASTGTTQHAAPPAIDKGEESGSASGSASSSASKDPNGRQGNGGLNALHAAMKGEQGQEISTDARANGGAVSKSEEVNDLRKHVADLETVIEHFLAAPLRKSMSGVSQLEYVSPRGTASAPAGRPEVSERVANLSKSEITAILTKKTASPTLAKADRQKVNGYFDGTEPLSGIAHLLSE